MDRITVSYSKKDIDTMFNNSGFNIFSQFLTFIGITRKDYDNLEEEYGFKPFDRVLVRDRNNSIWYPRFFSLYTNDPDSMFATTNGTKWRYCIPYEGNEDKAGKM